MKAHVKGERMDDNDQRFRPSRKTQPALLIMTMLLVPTTLFSVFVAGFNAGQWDVAGIAFFIVFGGLAILHLVDKGYELSADSHGIYMRDWGYKGPFLRHSERRMSYDEIVSIEGKFNGDAESKSMFMPFEFLELRSSNQNTKDIWIFPPAFRDEDIKELLSLLYEKRPDIFPDYAIRYMHSDRPL